MGRHMAWPKYLKREQYPNIYYIVCRKDDTVAKVLSTIPLNISFMRSLVEANL
jgi:hypothetical protein